MDVATDNVSRLLYEIAANDGGSTENKLQQALIVATAHLKMDVGIVSHIEKDDYTIQYLYAPHTDLEAGAVLAYKDTICYRTYNGHNVVAIEKLSASEYKKPPGHDDYYPEAYIATPIIADGKLYGTIGFNSLKPRLIPFTDADKNFVMMFSRWIGTTLKLLETERKLKAREGLLEGVIQSSLQGITAFESIRDDDGNIIDHRFILVNPVVQNMFAPIESNLVGKQLFKVFPYMHDTDLPELYKQVVETGKPLDKELLIPYSETGDTIWLRLSGVKLNDGLVITYQPITEQKQREGQLTLLAFKDSLTGLGNRASLSRDLPQLITMADRQKWTVAFLYFDLNNFKTINDTHGHTIGDQVLSILGQRLHNLARNSEPCVRLGGDEFLLVAANVSSEDSIALVARLIEQIETAIEVEQESFQLGVSIGVYLREPQDQTPTDYILRYADQAMFKAKRTTSHATSNYSFWSETLKEASLSPK